MSKVEDLGCSYSPWNFSWIDENKLAAMAWPQTPANLRFLVDLGIKCLVTLSPEMRPPIHAFPELSWVEIPIEEFEPPTISQIYEFIDVCKRYLMDNKPVGVHCRMGRGRTGVMAACYLVHFYNQAPERAILNVRLARPGSVETYNQEKAVIAYHDSLRHTSR
ncbi:dual specificity protein phosphatase 23 isoform X1 [Anabrus simplex]|uniref:dual specificity protein phosphatase 23 isoform X1 n=1 Tax=Anabrus simplex TaxID=316456 RepID=UPI0034DCF42E